MALFFTPCRRIIPSALLLVGLCWCACGGGGPKSWTVMYYANADNNLEPFIVSDFEEMKSAAVGGFPLTVVALLDRSPAYSTISENWSDTRLFELRFDSSGEALCAEISSQRLQLSIEREEELNLGDWNVLAAFVDVVVSSYSSDYYALIIGDHGSGWLPPRSSRAISWDESSFNASIGIAQVKQALAGKNIDVLILDACLMGSLEVAYELRHCAAYLVASPGNESAGGYDYKTTFELLPIRSFSPRTFASAFVEGYAESNSDAAERTFCYDLQTLADSVESGLIGSFVEHIASNDVATIRDAREQSIAYRYNDRSVYVDLVSLSMHAQFPQLAEALRHAIMGPDGCAEIAIYFPAESQDYHTTYPQALEFTGTTQWDEFLEWYHGI